ncbi:class I SAM-dependent methyltransferase [candidate division KSB1 bacterium]|nr:class I SAM-dependent methyltransferase [candidate division KSB1 bacterium]
MSDVKQEIQQFWDERPQTYGDTHGVASYDGQLFEPGTREFFQRLDKEFTSWNHPLHNQKPFDRLFPFDHYGPGHQVLEIGCGMGTMAMQWALHGVELSAIDLNHYAVTQTRTRFELFQLTGDIRQGDARNLDFPDQQFDYVYSWGVLHHSPNLEKSLAELIRVLKPGGRYGIMLYHRHSFLNCYWTHFIEGFLHYEHRFLGPLELSSRYGDGYAQEGNPHTWPVTRKEIIAMLRPHSAELATRTLGTELDSMFKLMLPGIGVLLPRAVKKCWARRFGWSLWIYGVKK